MIRIKRVITSVVGILILIPLLIISDTIWWSVGLSFFSFLAVFEMCRCIGISKIKKMFFPSLLMGLSPVIFKALVLCGIENFKAIALIITVYVFVMVIISILSADGIEMNKFAEALFFTLFVSIGFTFFVLIRDFDFGLVVLTMCFIGSWCSDTFAYFGGKLFGKHKLCPNISPKKTIEGAASGVVFNMLGFLLYGFLINKFGSYEANLVKVMFYGAVLSAVSQFGDLFMSRIKRHYGIKDYGTLFPGHGGSLDRFDSTLNIAYFVVIFNIIIGTGFLFR